MAIIIIACILDTFSDSRLRGDVYSSLLQTLYISYPINHWYQHIETLYKENYHCIIIIEYVYKQEVHERL